MADCSGHNIPQMPVISFLLCVVITKDSLSTISDEVGEWVKVADVYEYQSLLKLYINDEIVKQACR